MIYVYQNNMLYDINEYDNLKETLFYPENIKDIRNYVISIGYKDTYEQVARSLHVYFHQDYFKQLYKVSDKLSEFIEEKDLNDLLHDTIDRKIAANGNWVAYHSEPAEKTDLNYGYICLPEELNNYQKTFLRERLIYLETYRELLLSKYNRNKNELEELNTLGDGEGFSILKKIVNS